MKKPKMIIFDYGQTLVSESRYDYVAGYNAMLKHAVKNPENKTAEELIEMKNSLYKEIWSRQDILEPRLADVFRYLFEYYSIELDVSYEEIELIYWLAACTFSPCKNIQKLIEYLRENGIRSAVISNLDYCEGTLDYILKDNVPDNDFEFVLVTSEYAFRKPYSQIFDLACKKAGLDKSEVIYCGNDGYADVDGAARYGIHPVWYKGSDFFKSKADPSFEHTVINDWDEMIEFLERCE